MEIRKFFAEFVGTLILMYLGALAVVSAVRLEIDVTLFAAFGFGGALLIAIVVIGPVSGAHLNPAVSLAMWLDRRMAFSDMIAYWIAQTAGAFVAWALVWAGFDSDTVAATYTTPGVSVANAFIIELVLTTFFAWVILAVTRNAPSMAAFVIPLALVGIHFSGVPLSGASVNPVRSLAPGIIGGQAPALWVFLTAPLAGGVVAWILFRWFPSPGTEPSD